MRPANSLRGCSTSKPLIDALRFGTGRGSFAQCESSSERMRSASYGAPPLPRMRRAREGGRVDQVGGELTEGVP